MLQQILQPLISVETKQRSILDRKEQTVQNMSFPS